MDLVLDGIKIKDIVMTWTLTFDCRDKETLFRVICSQWRQNCHLTIFYLAYISKTLLKHIWKRGCLFKIVEFLKAWLSIQNCRVLKAFDKISEISISWLFISRSKIYNFLYNFHCISFYKLYTWTRWNLLWICFVTSSSCWSYQCICHMVSTFNINSTFWGFVIFTVQ